MTYLHGSTHLRLGVNIDHVATIRNARGGMHPDPVRAALAAADAGADGITAHLREDRRHISDEDIAKLKGTIALPLNLEMAPTQEMLDIALRSRPNASCLVPEKRQEITTEGGLDIVGNTTLLKPYIAKLRSAGIRVSLFIDPDERQIEASSKVEADIVELHTGVYCEARHHNSEADIDFELKRLKDAAQLADEIGLEVHAGHGLDFESAGVVAAIPQLVELNIGHFLIGEAIFGGLDSSIRRMRAILDNARANSSGSKSA
ncbi:MAG: pyridoxine 5'-phosphate synthase [Methyloligellaceae bacterium]